MTEHTGMALNKPFPAQPQIWSMSKTEESKKSKEIVRKETKNS